MQLLDGKQVSQYVLSQLQAEHEQFKQIRKPHLAVIMVGKHPASETYVHAKLNTCEKYGFQGTLFSFEEHITESTLLKHIALLNQREDLDGIIVQLPLPKHISEQKVIEHITPEKDVDGFHPMNIGKMAKNLPCFLPATPAGVLELLSYYQIETEGKHCVVVGRSLIVGSPMSMLMGRNAYPGNCTVTLCHSKTKNLADYTKQADILIVAAGQMEMITQDLVKAGAVVIDVGIHRKPDPSKKSGFRLVGDVCFEVVAPLCSYITPVPGGVGPMTIACLLKNTLIAWKNHFNL